MATRHNLMAVEVPSQAVDAHVEYVAATDPNFRRWWQGLPLDQRQRKQQHLDELCRLATALRVERDVTGGLDFIGYVDKVLAQCMCGLPNTNFTFQPDPEPCIRDAMDESGNHALFDRGLGFLNNVMSRQSGQPIEVYGSVKDAQSLHRQIAAFKMGAPLDLWDVVRFRVVAQALSGVAAISTRLSCEAGNAVVRFRNYFTHPRTAKSLHRAIHINLALGGRFIEVQVMTASREIVCQLDHGIAFKGCIEPHDEKHMYCLRQLSLAANVHDATNGCWSWAWAGHL